MKGMRTILSVILAAGVLQTVPAQMQTIDIGEVDLFGQSGLNEQMIRGALTLHAGERIKADDWPTERTKLEQAVKAVIGKSPTDVAIVFFDEHGKSMIFVGLPGPAVTRPRFRPSPKGAESLPGDGLQLYRSLMDRLAASTSSAGFKEDDSKGYALFSDPQMHAIQLQMRDYALANEFEIRETAEKAASADQRQAAAMLLGYAKRSKAQIANLADAALDENDTVRNNAVRSLIVIANADPSSAALYPIEKFVPLLNSGTWTDRNKGGWLVEALTRGRDRKLLALLRARALSSLIEMAKWTNPPHAKAARQILGRIGGIPETRIRELIDRGDIDAIVAAAKGSGKP